MSVPYCCSVTQLFPALCNPMDCSTPGFPVLHHLPEFDQTHVHWVGDAIQPSCPLSSPSPPAFNLSGTRAFSNESVLHLRWPKYWSFSFSTSPFNDIQDWFALGLTGLISLQSQGLSQESPPTPHFKSNPSALSLLYGQTLTSIHDYWENHSSN